MRGLRRVEGEDGGGSGLGYFDVGWPVWVGPC